MTTSPRALAASCVDNRATPPDRIKPAGRVATCQAVVLVLVLTAALTGCSQGVQGPGRDHRRRDSPSCRPDELRHLRAEPGSGKDHRSASLSYGQKPWRRSASPPTRVRDCRRFRRSRGRPPDVLSRGLLPTTSARSRPCSSQGRVQRLREGPAGWLPNMLGGIWSSRRSWSGATWGDHGNRVATVSGAAGYRSC